MASSTEKIPEHEIAAPGTPTSPPQSHLKVSNDLDAAFNYIQNANNADYDTSSVNLKALRRKIDWRIVPMMFLCYTMQFLDKVNINVSRATPTPNAVEFGN